jgi:ABC-type sugar transport system permease subunit
MKLRIFLGDHSQHTRHIPHVSLLLINSLKVFDIVWVVTRNGPGIATDVLATNMIVTSYDQRLFSAGAAIGVIIFLIAFILVIPYTIYALKKWFE